MKGWPPEMRAAATKANRAITAWFCRGLSVPFTENVLGEPRPYSITRKRFDGLEQRLGFQQHAFAAAERAVIDGAMAVVREGAQVVHVNVHETRLARPPHDSVIQRACKKFRENRDDLELHGRDSVTQQLSGTIQIEQAFREGHVNALGLHIDVNTEFGCHWHQDFALARIDREQRSAAWKFDVAHATKRR
jgi:hypothetical protein